VSVPQNPTLPDWADRIRRTYLRGESSLFLLHHNVFDRIQHQGRLYTLTEFLVGPLLERTKQTIVVYDPSSRVRKYKAAADAVAIDAVIGRRQPGEVLPALEELLLTANSVALVIAYADMLAPAGEMQFLSEQDRVNVVTLHRWSLDTRLAERDSVVFVVAEQISALHPILVSNPRVVPIEVPMPDLKSRLEICRLADPALDAAQAERLAPHTPGLKAE